MNVLPQLLVLTDRRACARRDRGLVETVESAVAAGARGVVLREKDLPWRERRRLGIELRSIVPLLIVASDVALACEIGADGVHLAASDAMPAATSRDPELVVGRSCHSPDDVVAAGREGAAYATLSPVYPSISKPGYGPTVDLDDLAHHLGGHAIPVYALGGVASGRAATCLAAGATGVAVMGAVMGAADPGGAVAALRDEIGRASPPSFRIHAREETR